MHTASTNQKIAVTGATGRVGSPLVEILEQRGHDVVRIARSQGVDVISGEGLDAALAGVETIIDTATGPSPDQESATEFFTTSAQNLQRAGAAAGAKRIVVVSIIGIDKFHSGYNAAKVAQEQVLLEGPCRSGSSGRPSSTNSSSRWWGGRSRTAWPTCPRCRRSWWPPAWWPRPSPTRPRSPRSGTVDHRGGGPAGGASGRCGRRALCRARRDVEIREGHGGPLADPDDPDAAAYAEGGVLPDPGARLAGPSFEEWLAAA